MRSCSMILLYRYSLRGLRLDNTVCKDDLAPISCRSVVGRSGRYTCVPRLPTLLCYIQSVLPPIAPLPRTLLGVDHTAVVLAGRPVWQS